MKKMNYILCTLLMITASLCAQKTDDQISELYIPESEFVLKLDADILDICHMLADEWRTLGHTYADPDFEEMLMHDDAEIDIETALKALYYCMHSKPEISSEQEEYLRNILTETYYDVLAQYNNAIAQAGPRRRIKIKFFNKVTTCELQANNAFVDNVTIKKNLKINAPSGALISRNGLVTVGQIPPSAVPDGAITNPKLSHNPPAVDATVIAPMTVTPSLMAFNTVQTFASEPNPLRIYRGSVSGAGAVTSGSGFVVTRTGAGAYRISITGPAYTSDTTYQVFIQLLSETDPVTVTFIDGTQFTVNTVADHDFSFFTIGN